MAQLPLLVLRSGRHIPCGPTESRFIGPLTPSLSSPPSHLRHISQFLICTAVRADMSRYESGITRCQESRGLCSLRLERGLCRARAANGHMHSQVVALDPDTASRLPGALENLCASKKIRLQTLKVVCLLIDDLPCICAFFFLTFNHV